MLRAIVFDFDGVIANSEPMHFRAYRDVLSAHGIELSEADYFGRYLGFDDQGAFEAVGADNGVRWSREDIAAMIDAKAIRMEALEREGAILFPGAADAVRTASAIMPIAIASGALGIEIRRVLDHVDLSRCFSAIVAAEDTPVSKPAPDPYIRAVSLLAATHGPLAPHECVAIEDSHWGLESAREAGLKTVAVAHTYRAADLGQADLVIPSIQAFDLQAIHAIF